MARHHTLKCAMTALVLATSGLAACGAGDDATAPQASAQEAAAPINTPAPIDVTSVLGDARTQAAFDWLEATQDDAIDTLIALTEIPAPPFQETVRGEEVARRLRALGLEDVHTDSVGNVIARRPGTEGTRTIAVAAHIDTVFPPETEIVVRREGDTFYAPGIGDNTRGVVMMLSLVQALNEAGIQTRDDLLFVGSVGEEGLGDLRGVRHLFGGDHGIDSFIAIDGGGDGRLVVSAVGSNRYRVTFRGPGGHSYGAFGRAHPHQALGRAITGFTERAEPITQQDGPRATFSVGRIGGGTSINSIPFESWMEVDMRSTDPRRLDALDAAFREAMADALAVENARRTEDDAMTVDIENVGQRPAGQGDETLPLVRHAIAAMEASGMQPRLAASSTDANIPIWMGIPAVTIGRGGTSRNAHALDESWTSEDVQRSERAALLLLLLEAGMAAP